MIVWWSFAQKVGKVAVLITDDHLKLVAEGPDAGFNQHPGVCLRWFLDVFGTFTTNHQPTWHDLVKGVSRYKFQKVCDLLRASNIYQLPVISKLGKVSGWSREVLDSMIEWSQNCGSTAAKNCGKFDPGWIKWSLHHQAVEDVVVHHSDEVLDSSLAFVGARITWGRTG